MSEPVLRDTNLHVEVVSISNVDVPDGKPLSTRQPRPGASAPGFASAPRVVDESADGAGTSQTNPVPAVRFTWPSSLPQPLCVKARRDNQHKHLACMRSVVTLGEDRAMFKAVAGDFTLENEDVTVDRYALKPNPSGVIDLRLVSKGTAALLQAFIPTTASATDVVTGKTFIQYCITVRCVLAVCAAMRYSDEDNVLTAFADLTALSGASDGGMLTSNACTNSCVGWQARKAFPGSRRSTFSQQTPRPPSLCHTGVSSSSSTSAGGVLCVSRCPHGCYAGTCRPFSRIQCATKPSMCSRGLAGYLPCAMKLKRRSVRGLVV